MMLSARCGPLDGSHWDWPSHLNEQRKLINFFSSPIPVLPNFFPIPVQGKSLVFVNEIPILNADQLIKNGLVHEISKINLPKALMDECNCIEPAKNQSLNTNLSNKDILIRDTSAELPKKPSLHANLEASLESNLLDSNQKSTIIPESMKRKYVTLHNRQYKPIAAQSRPNQSIGRPDAMFKPMVFYDLTDRSYYTTPSPKVPVPYHNNHNYYNPSYNGTRVKPNFFVSDANSLAYPANSLPSYSALPDEHTKLQNLTLESAFLTMFDPFSPYANQTFSNPRTQFHAVNTSQSSPSMTYMTHIYHADNSQVYTNHALPSQTPAFIYNMERLGIQPPPLPQLDDRLRLEAANHQVQIPSTVPSTTQRPYLPLNTKSVVYQVVPTVSSVSVQDYYPTKSKQPTNSGRIPISSKYYNDLTTPTPMYFDPTRKPKSPSYLNRIRRVNDLINGQSSHSAETDGRLLSTSYQVLDSNVVQKIEDTKTSSNNKQQVVVPARLDLSQLNQLTANQFSSNRNYQSRNSKNRNQPTRHRSPQVTVSTVNDLNQTTSTRDGRIMKNFKSMSNTPFITLLDVLKNPYLMINNEPVEFSYFEALLNQTSLSGLLSNRNGQITLVLPTNAAFRKLKDYELEFLRLPTGDTSSSLYSSAMRRKRQLRTQRQDELRTQVIKNLVLNHISPILVNPDSIVSQVTAKSYSNHNLVFTRKANKLYLNDLPVLATTIVSNGVAYVVDTLVTNNRTLFEVGGQPESNRRKVSGVDSVLNPTLAGLDTSKLNSSRSVVELIENIPELSFFTGLVKKSNYSNLLAGSNGVYTVLAPENKAFSYLPHNAIDLLRNSQSFIDRFVGHHLIGGNFSLNNLVTAPSLLNLNRLPIKIENNNGMILLNGTSMVRRSNILAATGFIHILTHSILVKEPYTSGNVMMLNIRKPIFEEPTLQDQLMEIAKSRSSAKFLTLFIQNNYIGMLRAAKKNFTLLLPSDVAYYSLPENVINKMENSSAKLKTLLNYHLLNRLVDPYELQTLDQLSSSTDLPLHYANVTALNDQKPSSINLLSSEHSRLSLSYSIMANETQMEKRMSTDHLANIRKLTEQLRVAADKNQLSLSGANIKEARLIEVDSQPAERNERKNYVEILFVDRVLYTPKGTIYDLIKSSPMLTVLNQLVEITNLKDELNWQLDDHDRHRHHPDQMKPNGYTFFAPSNSAFVSGISFLSFRFVRHHFNFLILPGTTRSRLGGTAQEEPGNGEGVLTATSHPKATVHELHTDERHADRELDRRTPEPAA